MADAVDRVLVQWARERPDLDTSPMGVVGRISRVARLADAALRQNFASTDLDPPSFDVLATLRRAGAPFELTPGELVRMSMVTSGAVSQRLDRLEERGLVTRRRSPADARGVLVRLSEAGRRAVEDVLPSHLATEEKLLAPLTGAEQAQLADLLRRLLAAHERPADERGQDA